MPETPKQKPIADVSKHEEDDKDSWSEDQKKHEYYYDDAHGYEVYEPDKDDDEDQASA
jgi:hypothetical protein